MSTSVHGTTIAAPGPPSGRWRLWPVWTGYAAAAWSLVYGLLGLYWVSGGAGFPFGRAGDPIGHTTSVLGGLSPEAGAPAIAVLSLVGTILALAMARSRGQGVARIPLLTFAWLAAVSLAMLIPDNRVLTAVAYAPIFLVGAPFHFPPVSYLEAVPWPVLNQLVCLAGGLLWAGTAVAYQRRTGGACEMCGRGGRGATWTAPAAAASWGRWAVGVAVAVPVVYATSRYAWLVGVPLGVTPEFLRALQATQLTYAGAGLATVALGGALLTLGLVQPWGEVYPRWIPLLGGKRVRLAIAIVPAALMAVIITETSLAEIRVLASGHIGGGLPNVGAWAPSLLWPLWGAALGAATLAYYYRRRGRCNRCGRSA